MAWVRVDDAYYDHPKWATAPGDSVALWLAAMAWCNRNESVVGFIPTPKLAGIANVRNLKATVADLVAREAFYAREGGYVIHDYEEYQQNEKVQAIRAKRSESGKKGAAARWEKASGKANAMANAMATECPEPVPDPEALSSQVTTPPTDCTADRLEAIASCYAKIAADRATDVRNKDAYARKARTRILADPELVRLANLFPTAEPSAVAGWLHGDKGSMAYYPRADELAPVIPLDRSEAS